MSREHQLFLLYFNIFFMLLCCILDVYLSFLFVCTESLALLSYPTSCNSSWSVRKWIIVFLTIFRLTDKLHQLLKLDLRRWWIFWVKRNIPQFDYNYSLFDGYFVWRQADLRRWWSLSVKRNIRQFDYNYSLFVDL